MHISDKKLVAKIWKEPLQVNNFKKKKKLVKGKKL